MYNVQAQGRLRSLIAKSPLERSVRRKILAYTVTFPCRVTYATLRLLLSAFTSTTHSLPRPAVPSMTGEHTASSPSDRNERESHASRTMPARHSDTGFSGPSSTPGFLTKCRYATFTGMLVVVVVAVVTAAFTNTDALLAASCSVFADKCE